MKSIFKCGMVRALLTALAVFAQSCQAANLTGRDVHIDGPLSNIAVEAWKSGNFVAEKLFPTVPVQKQSDGYYIITKNTWLRTPSSTLRAPKTAPRRIEFDVSTDTYFANNYALAGENSKEALANSDSPILLRARTARLVVESLMRDKEQRIANKVTSITNIGSGVVLTGGNKWSDYLNSDPVSDITTGHAFIRQNTGVKANTLLLDEDTSQILRRHPVLLDMYKYTQGGLLNDAELLEVFKVKQLLISDAIRNAANEGGTASIVNIWGNNALLCYIDTAPPGLQTCTFGLGFNWQAPELVASMAARVYDDPDPGKKLELTEVGYYADEKIIAQQLSYLVGSTL
ncbi:MAG: hypothetical protein U1E51_07895 [Candidatus Binatia bacterium]|nr:hypothetical protein [Candidatus Binatia bacterium]